MYRGALVLQRRRLLRLLYDQRTPRQEDPLLGQQVMTLLISINIIPACSTLVTSRAAGTNLLGLLTIWLHNAAHTVLVYTPHLPECTAADTDPSSQETNRIVHAALDVNGVQDMKPVTPVLSQVAALCPGGDAGGEGDVPVPGAGDHAAAQLLPGRRAQPAGSADGQRPPRLQVSPADRACDVISDETRNNVITASPHYRADGFKCGCDWTKAILR